ncbi:PhzF family phenazine biosynthesis protein [Proteiniclasticum sp. SCR006]|uniref:PhzF family phenazine biosynthesis protein n=1 Tax=Proteiniclasticum aestuarii TaxID=2817862 RepID=A0A939HA65_9CLOT|nr:PhzF family phenazine biosynthesis protein [Proteiniclasticum aestuarii]MBO1263588.1 PhzF family phenazine biosynthesis protein [Proteiniclasticum aestuarii]
MIEVYTTNSFAEETGGGNPAAVVLEADSFSEQKMQEIAQKIGFSETAFVMRSSKADRKVRYFTPVREVDLCGHATIAVFSLLRDLNILASGQYRLETVQEELHIEISPDSVMMELSRPIFFEYADPIVVSDSLNIDAEDLLPEHLPQFVSTGLKDLIIPVRTKAVLDQIRPDFDKITHLSDRHDAEGYHLFAMDEEKVTAYTRNFAPSLGISEESATGTASGALAAYLHRYGLISDNESASLVFLQGEAMGRSSIIRASIEERQGEIRRIFVGGSIRDTKKIHL